MQIKCPGCSKVLNIPDSAAGKLVQCPCGKQIKAPGGQSVAAPAATSPQRAVTPANQPKPAAAPATGGGLGLDDDLFGELTDVDMGGITAVSRPGTKPASATAGPSKMLQEMAGEDADGGKKKKRRKPGGKRSKKKVILIVVGLLILSGAGAGIAWWFLKE